MVRPEGSLLTGETGWGVFPGPLGPKAGSSGFGSFVLLGSRESRLAHTASVSVPDVSDTALGARVEEMREMDRGIKVLLATWVIIVWASQVAQW